MHPGDHAETDHYLDPEFVFSRLEVDCAAGLAQSIYLRRDRSASPGSAACAGRGWLFFLRGEAGRGFLGV